MTIDCDCTGILSVFIPRIKLAVQILRQQAWGLKAIVLFGSVATGMFGINSDIDLLVILDGPEDFIDCNSSAEDVVNAVLGSGPPVQIITTTLESWLDYSRDTFFKDEVGREGIILWKK